VRQSAPSLETWYGIPQMEEFGQGAGEHQGDVNHAIRKTVYNMAEGYRHIPWP
jgi:hypothetical protein